MNSFLVALWKYRKKVLIYSKICSLGSTRLIAALVCGDPFPLTLCICKDMNSGSQFQSNVLCRNMFPLVDPGSVLEEEGDLGWRPWPVHHA